MCHKIAKKLLFGVKKTKNLTESRQMFLVSIQNCRNIHYEMVNYIVAILLFNGILFSFHRNDYLAAI